MNRVSKKLSAVKIRSRKVRLLDNLLIGAGSILEILPPAREKKVPAAPVRPRYRATGQPLRVTFVEDLKALATDKAAVASDIYSAIRQIVAEMATEANHGR